MHLGGGLRGGGDGGRLGGGRATGVLMMVADLFGAFPVVFFYDESAAPQKVIG